MRYLKLAAWAGVLNVVITLPQLVVEVLRGFHVFIPSVAYLSLNFLAELAFLFFVWGFKVLGEKSKNSLLRLMSLFAFWFSIFGTVLVFLQEFSFALDRVIVGGLIVNGIIEVLFGYSLLRLKKFGSLAKSSGVLAILVGASFVLIIVSGLFALFGVLLVLPTFIVQTVLLFKAAKKLKA
jgi:hypothetical protein